MASYGLYTLLTATGNATGTELTTGNNDQRTFQAVCTGTGAVTATVTIQGSLDKTNWVTITTLSLSGTAPQTASYEHTSAWTYIRATSASVTGTGATVSVYVALNRKREERISDDGASFVDAANFGVVADGVTDNTASLQAAVDVMLLSPNSGRRLCLPSGTILVSGTITIPTSQGWVIEGASRGSTKIIQQTSNTPVFKLTGNLTNNFRFSDIYFEYASAQSSSNTNAIFILFDSGTDTTIYNFVIEHCSFNKCFRAIATAESGSTRLAVWGVTIRECDFFGDMSGAGVWFKPSTSIGQPIFNLDRLYFRCDNATEPSIYITVGQNVTLRNVEFNLGNYDSKQQLWLESCEAVTLIGCRSEDPYFTTSGTKVLWNFPASQVTAIGSQITAGSGVINTAGSVTFLQANTGGYLQIVGLHCNGTNSNSGALIPYQAGTLGVVTGYVAGGGWLADPRTALGGTSAPRLNTYKAGDGVHTRGDADVTLTIADLKYQYFNTTLTANRTVNLPTTNLVDGYEFVIQRTGLGAFTLTINDGSATNQDYTIASATKGFVHYRCIGSSGWIITAAGTLP